MIIKLIQNKNKIIRGVYEEEIELFTPIIINPIVNNAFW